MNNFGTQNAILGLHLAYSGDLAIRSQPRLLAGQDFGLSMSFPTQLRTSTAPAYSSRVTSNPSYGARGGHGKG